MKKAYIEVSLINRSVDQGHDANSLAEQLRVLGYEPVIGLHVVYELAKCFLTGDITRGRWLFVFVDDLAPSFHSEPQQLMEREIERFRHGKAVLPFLDHQNHISMLKNVRTLRAGKLPTELREIIERRETDIRVNRSKDDALFLEQVDRCLAQPESRLSKGGERSPSDL
jgi:hypothetical protein